MNLKDLTQKTQTMQFVHAGRNVILFPLKNMQSRLVMITTVHEA